jgi:hypothetical protein
MIDVHGGGTGGIRHVVRVHQGPEDVSFVAKLGRWPQAFPIAPLPVR